MLSNEIVCSFIYGWVDQVNTKLSSILWTLLHLLICSILTVYALIAMFMYSICALLGICAFIVYDIYWIIILKKVNIAYRLLSSIDIFYYSYFILTVKNSIFALINDTVDVSQFIIVSFVKIVLFILLTMLNCRVIKAYKKLSKVKR